MQKYQAEITNETGLHTRPGSVLVKIAKKYPCDIFLKKDDKEFSLKSLVKLMKAGVSKGDCVEIRCEGEREEEALREISEYLKNLKE